LKKINIIGASGHAKSVIDVVESAGYVVGTIIDDDNTITSVLNHPVNNSTAIDTNPLLIAIGDNHTRKGIATKYKDGFAKALVHATAVVSPSATLKPGTVVMPRAIINADSKIGMHCIINTAAVIEHDCVLGDYVHISPNATLAGDVTVGEGTQIGIGASVIPGIKIGNWCTIGAGAVIIKDVPDGVTVVGNPGREV
jgi:sugar O-acyltransferase (sialic acid O-acetyltransferase NeuD family)